MSIRFRDYSELGKYLNGHISMLLNLRKDFSDCKYFIHIGSKVVVEVIVTLKNKTSSTYWLPVEVGQ